MEGSAILNNTSGVCVCPQWANENVNNPCEFVQCPNTTDIYYSAPTNQCICKVKDATPLLIHQATDQVPQQNATVYSVLPYFMDGVISFHLQLSGAPDGFNLNASTTIVAGSIGTHPQPNLILVPKNKKSRVPKSAEETALVIAVTFNSDDTIAYHVQLNNGTVVKLFGDKFVHDIDLIDPNAPPDLSILTSRVASHIKRVVPDQNKEGDSEPRDLQTIVMRRGIEGISSYTATFSEESCRSITCINNGGKRAMFNPFLNSCYCQTLVAPESHLKDRAEMSPPYTNEGLDRRDVDKATTDSVFRLSQPSSATCRHMIACPGESEPFFDQGSGQCLCVVFRTGIKEPVIASDTIMLPRTEPSSTKDEGDSQANYNEALSLGLAFDRFHPEKYCRDEFSKRYCLPEAAGIWYQDHGRCVCIPNSPEWVDDTFGTVSDSPMMPSIEKCSDRYSRCRDNIQECLSDRYHFRCDSGGMMAKHQQNDVCEKKL